MRYWVYINGEVPGSYDTSELAGIQGFNPASMVCPAEGSLAERNWQRAGMFPDIIKALEDRPSRPFMPAPPRPVPGAAGPGLAPEDVLDQTSQRLFRHVAELMKELENRREERALTQSLQRTVVELKNELLAARERIRFLDDRAALIPAFEEREQKLQEQLVRAKQDCLERERAEEDLKREAEEVRRRLDQALGHKAEAERLAELVDQLNSRLAREEARLLKATGMLRRLEEELGYMLPEGGGPRAATSDEPAGIWPRAPREAPAPDLPPPHPMSEPSEPPQPPPASEQVVPGPAEWAAEPAAAAAGAEPGWTAPPEAGAPAEAPPPAAEGGDVLELKPGQMIPFDAAPEPWQAPEGAAPPAQAADGINGSRKAYTSDEGKVEEPAPLPPEGVVAPVTPPWKSALARVMAFLKTHFPLAPPDDSKGGPGP